MEYIIQGVTDKECMDRRCNGVGMAGEEWGDGEIIEITMKELGICNGWEHVRVRNKRGKSRVICMRALQNAYLIDEELFKI